MSDDHSAPAFAPAELLVVDGDELYCVRSWSDDEWRRETIKPIRFFRMPGLGWVGAIFVRVLKGETPALRGKERRSLSCPDPGRRLSYRSSSPD